MTRLYLSSGEVARRLRTNRKTVWRWIAEGRIQPDHRTIGGHYRFHRDYIERLSIAAHELTDPL